jgi:hypothetical protein
MTHRDDHAVPPRAAFVWLGALACLTATGCPIANGDPAPYACRANKDCFETRGEYCEGTAGGGEGTCRLKLDSGVADRRIIDFRRADKTASQDGLKDGNTDSRLQDARDQ